MTCPRHDDLSAYMDDMLTPGERGQLAGHVSICPLCQGRLDQLSVLGQSLRELQSPALGFDLSARLEERLRATSVRSRPSRRFWSDWAPGGLSAAVALASGVWLGGLLIGGAVSAPPSAISMRVFDPVPPGGLCAAPELCRVAKGLQ